VLIDAEYCWILIQQIDEQRHYIEKICRSKEHVFGLPHSIVSKQLISVLSDRLVVLSYECQRKLLVWS